MHEDREVGIGGPMTIPLDLSVNPLNQLKKFLPLGYPTYLKKGRDCIRLICQQLNVTKSDEAILPEFICPVGVIRPFQESGMKIKFYKLDENLNADLNDLERKITPQSRIILVNNAFGFPQPMKGITEICAGEGIHILEDCAMAFLSKNKNGELLGNNGDASFFSFRKSAPVPDGAVLITTCSSDVVENKISPISRWLLKRFDYGRIIKRRHANYQYLLDHIKNKKIDFVFPKLPKGTVPLCFPVRIKNPQAMVWKMAKYKIFCPLYYPETKIKVLGIPIDQRYRQKDMEYVARCVNGI